VGVTGTQVVRQFVTALVCGELDGGLELVEDGIVFSEAQSLPFGGDWTGKQGVRDLFAAVSRHYRVRMGPPEVLCGSDAGVVVRMHGTISGRASGAQLPLDCLDLYQVTRGLIRRVDVFYKDAAAVAALAGRPARRPGRPRRGRERLNSMSDQIEGAASGCTALRALGHDYDHYDPRFALDPHPAYRKLRDTCPVAHTGNYGGFYVLTKFADIAEVLHDAAVFSPWPADTPPTPGHNRALIPLEVDPPDHRRYRMIVDPIFRPKAIEHIAESVREYAMQLIDAMLDKREFDAIGFSFLHLARRPDLQDRLAAEPSLIPAAIEELLRYESIVHASRTVTEPRILGGTQLQPGDRVVVPLAAAHRDGAEFDRPDEILFDRKPGRAMVFGAGSHRCLGSYLARLQLRIAFEEILRRIPRFSLPPGAVLHAYGGQTRSLSTLPFRTWRDD